MKHPHVKKPWLGFHGAVEISALFQVAPSFVDLAWNVSISVSLGSLRLSNQITLRLPASSTEIHGKNWSCGAAAPLGVVEMVLASDQVAPKSVERVNSSARSTAVLQSSLTYGMSRPPWLSTTGVAHWFAPGPTAPRPSGTTAVWLQFLPNRSVKASCTGQKSLRPLGRVRWNLMKVTYTRPKKRLELLLSTASNSLS